jgi:hypothetical protein
VTSVQPVHAVVAPLTRSRLAPGDGDYVLLADDAYAKCLAANVEWHPDMAQCAGRWVFVVKNYGASVSVQLAYDKFSFPMTCVTDTVRHTSVLESFKAPPPIVVE